MGPFHCFIKVLKLFRFSADFISFGRPFQICGPIHDRLFDPNVVWLVWFGFKGVGIEHVEETSFGCVVCNI